VNRLELIAEELGNILIKHNLFMTTAESCTGGGIAYILTAINGSSLWFDRSFVTYSNEAKQEEVILSTGFPINASQKVRKLC
jgi:nicotinamide-nucleotide amidase